MNSNFNLNNAKQDYNGGFHRRGLPAASVGWNHYNQNSGYSDDSQIRYIRDTPLEADLPPLHVVTNSQSNLLPFHQESPCKYYSRNDFGMGFGDLRNMTAITDMNMNSARFRRDDFPATLLDVESRSIHIPSTSSFSTFCAPSHTLAKDMGASSSVHKSFYNSFDGSKKKNISVGSEYLSSSNQNSFNPPVKKVLVENSDTSNTRFIASVVAKEPKDAVLSEVGMRVLTGPVDKVLKWQQVQACGKVLFEVFGTLVSIRSGTKEFHKIILLREQTGPVLQCIFYEIDRPIPQLLSGSTVRCVGWFIGKNKMQVVSVREASSSEKASMHRLAFISQRAAQESLEANN